MCAMHEAPSVGQPQPRLTERWIHTLPELDNAPEGSPCEGVLGWGWEPGIVFKLVFRPLRCGGSVHVVPLLPSPPVLAREGPSAPEAPGELCLPRQEVQLLSHPPVPEPGECERSRGGSAKAATQLLRPLPSGMHPCLPRKSVLSPPTPDQSHRCFRSLCGQGPGLGWALGLGIHSRRQQE